MASWNGIRVYMHPRSFPIIWKDGRRLDKEWKKQKTELSETIDGVPVRTLYVGNLPMQTTNRELLNLFGTYGRVEKVAIVDSSRNGQNSRPGERRKSLYGFVTFSTPQEASRALKCKHKMRILNRKVFVNPADSWHQPDQISPSAIKEPDNADFDNKNDSLNEEEGDCDGKEEDEEEESAVSKLNDDCLRLIFSYIPLTSRHIIGLVCRRWRCIANSLWSTVKVLDFSKPPLDEEMLTLNTLRRYLSLCTNLTVLDLNQDSHMLSSSAIAAVAKACKNLEEIRFSHIDLHNRSLALLARSCPNLKAFYMAGCSNCYDGEMIALITKCNQLRKIGVRYNMSLNGKWLAHLNEPLEALSLQMCDFSPENLIEGIQKVKGTLKKLALISCQRIKSSDFLAIAEAVPDLRSLTLAGTFADAILTDSIPTISRFNNLIELDLERNCYISDEIIQDIVNNCPHLQVINLSGSQSHLITSQGLSLVGKLPELREIHFNLIKELNDQVLKTISLTLPNLERLHIAGSSELVTDEGCCSIISHCRKLLHLDVTSCVQVSKKTVQTAIQAAQIDNRKQKLTIVVAGSGINEYVSDSPSVILDTKMYCNPFLDTSLSEHILELFDDDIDMDDYPDPLDDLYDFEGLDLCESFDSDYEYSYYDDSDLDSCRDWS